MDFSVSQLSRRVFLGDIIKYMLNSFFNLGVVVK